ncbi:uncharacterized protein VTP21DRAFT_2510 [Calcarisporiella thermophila]|uniref:uncharacterized protein n=1 Tax=Calcarisporiella thermophila TaxID=911321 RepID=UPI003742EB7B
MLRILALHGYFQNDRILYKKTGALRRQALGKMAEMIFVPAPIVVPVPIPEEGVKEENNEDILDDPENIPLAWFRSNDEGTEYTNFSDTLTYLSGILDSQGPFDGVMGFSQGACMAALLTSLLETHREKLPGCQHPSFKFCWLVGGFMARPQTLQSLYSPKVKTPSLHVFGNLDVVVSPERSEELSSHFENPRIYRHEGGHFIPSTAAARKVYVDFLSQFVNLSTL